MLNEIQERKRCNRLVVIPWRNTILFQELIVDHFGGRREQKWESFQGWYHFGVGITSGAVHLTTAAPLLRTDSLFIGPEPRLSIIIENPSFK